MDKTAKKSNKANPQSSEPPQGSEGQPGTPLDEQFSKGAMREPEQMPSHDRDELKEVKDALQDLEEQKGDWSKGG